MKKLNIIQAYPEPGKSNLTHLKNKVGVYVIFEEKRGKRKAVYIGHSTKDLYSIVTRHFQSWDDPAQRRVTYPQNGKYYVKVFLTNKADAYLLERTLIYHQKPRDNDYKYQGVIEGLEDGRLKRVGDRIENALRGSKDEEQEFYRYNEAGELMERQPDGSYKVVF